MTSFRPPLETLLLAAERSDLADVIRWALHLETLMIPSERHCVIQHAGCALLYEISMAGHLLWVTWHKGNKRTQETRVAAIRTRRGWDIGLTAAPGELTQEAIEQLGGRFGQDR